MLASLFQFSFLCAVSLANLCLGVVIASRLGWGPPLSVLWEFNQTAPGDNLFDDFVSPIEETEATATHTANDEPPPEFHEPPLESTSLANDSTPDAEPVAAADIG